MRAIYAAAKLCALTAPRFITEKFREHVSFRPKYGRGGSKTRSEDALTIGRITDHAFQQCIHSRTLPPENDHKRRYARNALLALRTAGVRPVRTQLPVQYGCVGTRLDGIGVCIRGGVQTIVVIELKTTGRDPSDVEPYNATCALLPTLHVIGLPNSERTSHDIQAEVGRLGFVSTYPRMARYRTVSAVVVASRTRATVRFVRHLTSEGPPVHDIFRRVTLTGPATPHRFQRLPPIRDGGGIVRDALKRDGLKVRTTGANIPKSASFVCTRDGDEIVCGLRTLWGTLSDAAKKRDEAAIRRAAKSRRAGIVFRDGSRWSLRMV